ncbi:beta-propeller fold lactonase family protein [Actinomadura barringtoniae]|uniref:Beta-propeller fold lactonase family protein n=1 Tax=Actinomadura barringtoniae TaxID=1427535 RepID=A0A939T728_9ACTN|nr:beta-propeller fold lactonase family protein [Actinomadura barringtoniae]MBO2451584.1 beta-propeller fold lactonase family protein [Actinomadura barringtoniae]
MIPRTLGVMKPLVAVGVAAALLPVTTAPSYAGPPVGRTVYVTDRATDDVTVFKIGPGGRLAEAGRARTGDEPRGLVFSPDARYAYGVNGDDVVSDQGTVSVYRVSGGGLDPLGGPVGTGGDTSFGIAIDPAGKALYVTNIDSGTVTAFAIRPDGGVARLGEPVTTGFDSPRGVGVSPDGRWVFVSHGVPEEGRDDVVVTFAVNADRTLTRVGTPARVGSGGNGVAVSPDGRFLYVVSTGSDQVFGFAIGRDGSLGSLSGSPFAATDFPEGIALSPDGRLLFVSSPGVERPDDARAVSAYTVGQNGVPQPVAGSPFQAGSGPVGVAATPDGRHLYVSNFDSGDVSGFDVGPTGVLRTVPGSPFPTGGQSASFQSVSVLPDQGPVASFTVLPERVLVRFDASGSSDRDGRVVRYDWDFGDGTGVSDGGPRPAHRFPGPGTYTVKVTVTDDEGCSTDLVFTGTSALCNGSGRARASAPVVVRSPVPAPDPVRIR